MARELRHFRRLLIILAILIPLVIIAKPTVRTLEALWYQIVERRERVVDRSPATNSLSIDRTTVAHTSWGDGPVLLIWCDLVGNSGGGAGSSEAGVLNHGYGAAPCCSGRVEHRIGGSLHDRGRLPQDTDRPRRAFSSLP